MRIAALAFGVLALTFFIVRQQRNAPPVQAAEPGKTALLIRFGVDGVKDADWSGSIAPAPSRLRGWQFDANDSSGAADWKCITREQTYWDTPYEREMGPTSRKTKVTVKGVVAEFDLSTPEVRIATAHGSFTIVPDAGLWTAPRRFLDGRVEVRAAPAATAFANLQKESEDYPSLVEARDGTLWMAYQAWDGKADRIYVRRYKGSAWSRPEAVASEGGDYFRTAIAEDRDGKIWVAWAARTGANFDLYAKAYDGRRWTTAERLTAAAGSDIFHSLIRDRSGNLYLAYQSARSGNFDIYLRIYDGRRWSDEMQISSDPANDWEPVLAAAPDGRVTIVWDTYAKGDYDIVSRTLRNGKLGPLAPIANSGAFETRASVQYDAQGRLWIAWDEGDWNWGKDYGNLIPESGRGLLVRRQTRVAVLANGKLLETKAAISAAIPEDLRQVFQQPHLVLDERDAPWVFFRYRVNLPQGGGGGGASRAMWRTGATAYRNDRWLPMIEFPEGYGRIDAPVQAVRTRDGNLGVAWVSDGRLWPNGALREQEMYFASLPASSSAAPSDLAAFKPSSENLRVSHDREAEDVARVRAYRAKTGSAGWRIVRGDIHRHTDISWDGNRDGSLNDAYRYALDAAAFDFLGVCDHQAGGSVPYNWWMIQKAVDLFTIEGKFAPLYSYERSLPWPNGHRNVLFAERGRSILDLSDAERRGEEGAGKLYAYLRRSGGITTSHTSATGAGTDWRDSDPELEPVVEIYQGYRNSYEAPITPRQVGRQEASRFGAGFVWNAWAKGIKMGVQSSSDHVSTHISYAALYVDRLDRTALLAAMKARRTYAATDNLILDLRMGEHFLGESFDAESVPALKAYVRGTGPLARVALVKNNRLIYTAAGDGPELTFTYTDADAASGESYYYIRAEQTNGQIAWSSPIWVRKR
ncbi:MAG: hypothetical protein WD696_04455 [Bryobacteraceae bacterium]